MTVPRQSRGVDAASLRCRGSHSRHNGRGTDECRANATPLPRRRALAHHKPPPPTDIADRIRCIDSRAVHAPAHVAISLRGTTVSGFDSCQDRRMGSESHWPMHEAPSHWPIATRDFSCEGVHSPKSPATNRRCSVERENSCHRRLPRRSRLVPPRWGCPLDQCSRGPPPHGDSREAAGSSRRCDEAGV